jgi:hypothetical protein
MFTEKNFFAQFKIGFRLVQISSHLNIVMLSRNIIRIGE